MSLAPFKELTEITHKRFAECPLGKQLEGKVFNNSSIEYDESLGNIEFISKKGGNYTELSKQECGNTNTEVHHMPADSASCLERPEGPAIVMDKYDHRQTASCGNSKEAQEYRAKQRELIDQGNFREAVQMDIDDIHDKFDDKYDDGIAEMEAYIDELEKGGKI